MIKFEEHDGLLFRMLDKPVPLKENDENVLVRFITHGVIGEYVMEHWLDCNQENVPIYIDDVDSDGDVTVWIDENRNSHHCCPFPMFEIIGTFVEEGSAEWAWYQMMQGFTVSSDQGYPTRLNGNYVCCGSITLAHINDFLLIAVPTGWQIYKESKPDPPKEPDYVVCKRCGGSKSIPNPAVSNTAYTTCPKCGGTGYEIKDPCDAPNPESATQTPLSVSDATQLKVGDWVEFIDAGGHKSQGKYLSKAYDNAILIRDTTYNVRCVVPTAKIIRKLSPSEIIVRIGCLSGTVTYALSEDCFLLAKVNDPQHRACCIDMSMLDTQTRELVESLLRAQKEEEE